MATNEAMTPDLQRIVEALKACRERYRISDFGPAGPYVLEENTSWDLAINLGEFVEKEDAQAYIDAQCAAAMVRAIVPAELVALSKRAVPHWSFRDDAERAGVILAPSTNPAIGGDDVVLSCAYSDRMHEDDRANIKLAFEAVQWLRSLSAILGETQP